MYRLNFDGLFRERGEKSDGDLRTGIMCYGWVIRNNRQQVIAQGHGSYSHRHAASSNGAEYLALIEGLEALFDLGLNDETVLVIGDARSVIDQMQGLAEVTSVRITALHQRAMRLSQKIAGLHWQWVPRGQNRAADKLTRHALRQIGLRDMNIFSSIGAVNRSTGFRLIADLMICQRPALAHHHY